MKSRLGQNFLTSEHIAQEIVDTAKVTSKETVLEIGPGKGVLTRRLLERAGKVIVVEKDPQYALLTSTQFAQEIAREKLHVIQGDILELSLEHEPLLQKGYKVVANIPYYITGEILRMFLTAKNQPQSITLLVQKEVAERILARDSKPLDSARGKESVLSLSVKAYGEPKYIRTVKAGVFFPKPKVDSAVLHIENISRNFFEKNNLEEELFFKAVKVAFGQKRKTVGKTLSDMISAEKFTACNISSKTRPEDLGLAEWTCLLK